MFRQKLFVGFLFLLLIPIFAQAQASAPLIIWVRGDLYAVNDLSAPPTQITQNGTISGPALSPAGQMIAYKAAAPVGLEALGRVETSGFIAEFDLPGDIYVFNIPAQQTILVAGQPENASLFAEGVPDHAFVRSTPTWSPDGNMLVWTELDFGSPAPRLVSYELTTRTQRNIVDVLPMRTEAISPPHVEWGVGGIAVIGEVGETWIYDSDGSLLSSLSPSSGEDETPQEYAWVDADGQSLFAVLYSSGHWALFDPITGMEQAVQGVPVMVGTAEDSLMLRFGVLPDVGIFWETVDASGAFPAPPARVTLSPTGREVAFIGYPDFGSLAVWHNGEVITVPGTGSDALAVGAVLWGAASWRIGPEAVS